MKDILFQLSPHEQLKFLIEEPQEEIHCCAEAQIYLVEKNKELLLSSDLLIDNLTTFRNQIEKAVRNDLYLDQSINADIGYLYNQELQNQPGLTYKKLDGRDYWVGLSYLLWNYEYATWLYNDNKGVITIEISPIYPGNFSEEAIDYNTWIKKYQPYAIKTINKSMAKNWLNIANKELKKQTL